MPSLLRSQSAPGGDDAFHYTDHRENTFEKDLEANKKHGKTLKDGDHTVLEYPPPGTPKGRLAGNSAVERKSPIFERHWLNLMHALESFEAGLKTWTVEVEQPLLKELHQVHGRQRNGQKALERMAAAGPLEWLKLNRARRLAVLAAEGVVKRMEAHKRVAEANVHLVEGALGEPRYVRPAMMNHRAPAPIEGKGTGKWA